MNGQKKGVKIISIGESLGYFLGFANVSYEPLFALFVILFTLLMHITRIINTKK